MRRIVLGLPPVGVNVSCSVAFSFPFFRMTFFAAAVAMSLIFTTPALVTLTVFFATTDLRALALAMSGPGV